MEITQAPLHTKATMAEKQSAHVHDANGERTLLMV